MSTASALDQTPNRRVCQNCGDRVSDQFGKVFGDNEDVPHACPGCKTLPEICRGAAAGPNRDAAQGGEQADA